MAAGEAPRSAVDDVGPQGGGIFVVVFFFNTAVTQPLCGLSRKARNRLALTARASLNNAWIGNGGAGTQASAEDPLMSNQCETLH